MIEIYTIGSLFPGRQFYIDRKKEKIIFGDGKEISLSSIKKEIGEMKNQIDALYSEMTAEFEARKNENDSVVGKKLVELTDAEFLNLSRFERTYGGSRIEGGTVVSLQEANRVVPVIPFNVLYSDPDENGNIWITCTGA